MEERDGNKEVVRSQSEREYSVEEIGAPIEKKYCISTSRWNTNQSQREPVEQGQHARICTYPWRHEGLGGAAINTVREQPLTSLRCPYLSMLPNQMIRSNIFNKVRVTQTAASSLSLTSKAPKVDYNDLINFKPVFFFFTCKYMLMKQKLYVWTSVLLHREP